MKVALLGNAKSIHIVKFANKLSEKGHDITIISLSMHENENGNLDKRVKTFIISGKNTLAYYLASNNLKQYLMKEKFDVINAHYASGYGTLARLAKASPLVLNVWGSDVYDFPYKNFYTNKLIKRNLKYAKILVSTSHAMKKQVERLIEPTEPIRVVPFGVDVSHFKYVKRERKNMVTIGIIKTLAPKYGISYLIRAFKELLDIEKGKIETRLLIYGEGVQEDELYELAESLGILQNVEFKGYIDNKLVPNALSEFDIFVGSSTLDSESFGVALVEAMATGLPIVATDVSGFKEVVDDNKTGIIIPKENPSEMCEALKIMIENYNTRIQMGLAGYEKVHKLYDINKNTDELINTYSICIAKDHKHV